MPGMPMFLVSVRQLKGVNRQLLFAIRSSKLSVLGLLLCIW